MEDINISYNSSGYPESVEVIVKPATADNIEEQHVRVTLVVNLTPNYPDKSPLLELRNPRGIDDDVLKLIDMECNTKCEEYLGLPVIYELIELIREKLTANNTPSCPCAICLFEFTDNDHFTKTQCFHYFHSNCLGRYILNCEETAALEERENEFPAWMTREKRLLLCPVCREPLNDEVNGPSLLENPPPEEGELLTDFDPLNPEIKSLQEHMKTLYLHQKSKGGIINLEEEKNKFLVSASEAIEALHRDNFGIERVDNSQLPESKEEKKINKSDRQTYAHNNWRKGAKGRGGNYNQNKKEYSSNNYWYSGSREKHTKRSGKSYSGRSNPCAMNESGRSSYEDSPSNQGAKNVTKCDYRHSNIKPDNPDLPNGLKLSDSGYQNHDASIEETKKVGRRNYYKSYHSKGGGSRGGSSRGAPPPGFSELEKNIRPHATS